MAREKRQVELILPKENACEAALVKGLKVIGVETLKEAINHLEGRKKISPLDIAFNDFLQTSEYAVDLSWIKGQEYAKRALEIVAAGGHHLLMTGPPGTGKTLLAKALPSLLPPLDFKEALEITKIYSVAGQLPKEEFLINSRPFRSPHHTASEAALVGGGNPLRPGEITMAHRGVLFLDEFPEFHRNVLESLRQPLEEGHITVLRTRQTLTFPCRFTLIAAANPCPCGNLNNPEKECKCLPSQVAKYRRKLSGPLLDRFDLFIEVPQVKYEKLTSQNKENDSAEARARVIKARKRQKERFFSPKKTGEVFINAEMNIHQIKEYCHIDSQSNELLRNIVNSGKLSARGYHRILKVARTIADLDESEKISYSHLSEALMYRIKEI